MFLWLYNLCFPFVFLALLPGYLGRMIRRGDYRAQFGQRLGWYSPAVRARMAQGPSRLWLQAVSVGEMFTAFKLVAALRARSPELPLILSTTTTTGYRLARRHADQHTEVIYTPIDFLPVVRRAFRILKPSAMVVVDGGLWPNLLSVAHRRRVPTALVNARLSPRSESRFRRFRLLSRSIFAFLDLVCVSDEADVARWTNLGVSNDCLRRTGSIKYDDTPPVLAATTNAATGDAVHFHLRELLGSVGVAADRPILLAGSTHAGEEMIIARAFLGLRQAHPDLFLIIAPRHVERTSSVAEELKSLGLHPLLRTALDEPSPVSPAARADLLLLDTTGELKDWYSLATVAFVGKSLTAVGGQNPAEAISAGVPVLVGPHMENFAGLVHPLLAAGAIVQLRDAVALPAACSRLLLDAALRTRMVKAAGEQLEKHRGAAARTASLLLAMLQNTAC